MSEDKRPPPIKIPPEYYQMCQRCGLWQVQSIPFTVDSYCEHCTVCCSVCDKRQLRNKAKIYASKFGDVCYECAISFSHYLCAAAQSFNSFLVSPTFVSAKPSMPLYMSATVFCIFVTAPLVRSTEQTTVASV